jgi:hypothetical protein
MSDANGCGAGTCVLVGDIINDRVRYPGRPFGYVYPVYLRIAAGCTQLGKIINENFVNPDIAGSGYIFCVKASIHESSYRGSVDLDPLDPNMFVIDFKIVIAAGRAG